MSIKQNIKLNLFNSLDSKYYRFGTTKDVVDLPKA